jgi:hypothetical protein
MVQNSIRVGPNPKLCYLKINKYKVRCYSSPSTPKTPFLATFKNLFSLVILVGMWFENKR